MLNRLPLDFSVMPLRKLALDQAPRLLLLLLLLLALDVLSPSLLPWLQHHPLQERRLLPAQVCYTERKSEENECHCGHKNFQNSNSDHQIQSPLWLYQHC